MSDWELLIQSVTWFKPDATVTVGESQPWSRGTNPDLPELSALLAAATVTPVAVGEKTYELLAWGEPEARRGWLCYPPETGHQESVAAIHRDIWALTGGVTEVFGSDDLWWPNQVDVLDVAALQEPFAEALDAYAWIWRESGMEIPINPDDYYVAAVESNYTLTLVRRDNGNVLLFAPDPDYQYPITPFAGSPESSLYTFDDMPDLRTWIEVRAADWVRGMQ